MSKKLRKVGDITTDMEKYLRELLIDHDMQRHEVLGIVDHYILSHAHSQIERYTDGNISTLFIGHPDFLKKK